MAFDNGYALLVGIGEYQYAPALNVPHAARDAHALAEVLQDPQFCAYPPDHVTVLADADATRVALLNALNQLASIVTDDSTVVIVFSCWSLRDAQDVIQIICHDTVVEGKLPNSETSIDELTLQAWVASVRARHILLIFNNMAFAGVGARSLARTGAGRVVITACREGQSNFVGTGQVTMFSQALIDGLKGTGVPERNGYIGVYDLYAQLYSVVRTQVQQQAPADALRRAGGTQEPELYIKAGTLPFAVCLYRGGPGKDTSNLPPNPPSGTVVHVLENEMTEPETHTNPASSAPPAIDSVISDRITTGSISNASGIAIGRGAKSIVRNDDHRKGIFSDGSDGQAAPPGTINVGVVEGPASFVLPDRLPVPNQIPFRPEPYVSREIEERLLEEALAQCTDDQPLAALWGLQGTGKTSLASEVISKRIKDWTGGVVWCDLNGRAPANLLLELCTTLDPKWFPARDQEISGQQLWNIISNRSSESLGRVLIVFDNVESIDQLRFFLPSGSTTARILVISVTQLIVQERQRAKLVALQGFKSGEAKSFFRLLLLEQYTKAREQLFDELAQQLDYLPWSLTTIGVQLRDGKTTLDSCLRSLREGTFQTILSTTAITSGLELALKNLDPDQVELLNYASLLGEGSWLVEMLSAVALQPLGKIRREVEALRLQRLIEDDPRATGQRYSLRAGFRRSLRQRWQENSYEYQAAYHLLTHHCLNLLLDMRDRITSDSIANDTRTQPERALAFVQAFRAAFDNELAHIQQALDWSQATGAWDLMRRFSYLPHASLVWGLVSNDVGMRLRIKMATIEMLVVGARPDYPAVAQVPALVAPSTVFSRGSNNYVSFDGCSNTRIGFDQTLPERCVHSLKLVASVINRGIFSDVEFVDTEWIGVRAPELILRKLDMVGVRLLACDLRRSVWQDCDARQSSLANTDLSYALLQNVRLRGANLQRVNFTGAVLDNVDMCGADLRGADFSAVQIRNLKLDGSLLDDSGWAGAVGNIIVEESGNQGLVVQEQAAKEFRGNRPSVYTWPGEAGSPSSSVWDTASFEEIDLRGGNWSRSVLQTVFINKAHLQAATLTRSAIQMLAADVVDLRAANLTRVAMQQIAIKKLDLQGCMLTRAALSQINVEEACLFAADAGGISISQASFRGANFRSARLAESSLDTVDLTGADLTMADCNGASLSQISLCRATLTHANFANATLDRVDLTGATCLYTNFLDASVDDGALATVKDLSGATLPSGKVTAMHQGNYDSQVFDPEESLRFDAFEGSFNQTRFRRCDLVGARLKGNFRGANFRKSHLTHARLQGSFTEVDLGDAELNNADLQGDFSAANFSSANLESARLGQGFGIQPLDVHAKEARQTSSFEAANFGKASLRSTKLEGIFVRADLRDADLHDATFEGADLREANFAGAKHVSPQQLRQAYRLAGAIMPDGTTYNGRYNLAGDVESARTMKQVKRLTRQLITKLRKAPAEHKEDAEIALRRITAVVEVWAQSQPDMAFIGKELENLKQTTIHIGGAFPLIAQIEELARYNNGDMQQGLIGFHDESGQSIHKLVAERTGITQGDVTTKAQLQQLVVQLNTELQKAPADKAEDAERLATRVGDVVTELSESHTDREIVEFRLQRLSKAAQNLAAVLPTVLPIARDIANLVARLI